MPSRMCKLLNFLQQAQVPEQAQEMTAKAAAAVSVTSGATSVLASSWLQDAAIIVAIISGLAATWWHLERIYDARRKRKKDEDQSSS